MTKSTLPDTNQDCKGLCKYCGKEMYGRKRLYCNRYCRVQGKNKRLYDHICKECGMQFQSINKVQTYCGYPCSIKAHSLPDIICPVCNKTFNPYGKNTIHCSLECASVTRGNKRRLYPDRKARDREIENARRKLDIKFNLKNRMRYRMHAALKRGKGGKRWQDILGYSVDDLKKHLKKKFRPGMSWDKLLSGEIHIDHIVPVSVFNIKEYGDHDFMRCWALKNLQPMWAKDNMAKSDRIDKHFQPSLLP